MWYFKRDENEGCCGICRTKKFDFCGKYSVSIGEYRLDSNKFFTIFILQNVINIKIHYIHIEMDPYVTY